jgi:Fe-S cluster assembly protein SufD
MVAVKDGKDVYLSRFSHFEEESSDNGRSPLRRLRRAAIERFAALDFPTLKDEEWRFTNLAPLLKVSFEPAPADGWNPQSADGVLVCGLADALARHRDLVEPHLARLADEESHVFTALNTAFLRDGVFVYVPPGKVVEDPIHLTFAPTATDRPLAWHRRCLIVAGANSRAQVVEDYEGTDGVYFTNAVTEVVAAENAVLDHYRVQREGKEAFHIATVQVRQERGSRFTSHAFADGGALARTDLNVRLDAEDCECTLNGLYLASGDRLVDNHTRIDHARPRCTSHELYKGILDGRARGVFNGKIYVHPDAQKTDARQTSKTLLLSDDAVIDAKPQLEIFADDVKCTHGASIGQLDEEAIFYLRTRGIGREDARRLLTRAFANDIIGRVRIDALRERLEAAIGDHKSYGSHASHTTHDPRQEAP